MIIDHVDRLELSENDVEKYYNQLQLLHTLATGLDYLYRQVSKLEDKVNERLDTKNRLVVSYGNNPKLRDIPFSLISCAFRWYSVTACDYVRIVGWLTNEEDTKRAWEYLVAVLPEVRIWRNKFGAHSAFVDPWKDDTVADLMASSIAWDIGFSDDSFVASELTISLGSEQGGSTSRQDMNWSLKQTHQQLAKRYGWPST